MRSSIIFIMKLNINLLSFRNYILFAVVIIFLPFIDSCNSPSQESICNGKIVTFEDLAVGANYNLGDSFLSDGVTFTVVQFIWSNNNPSTGGTVNVADQQLSGGTGNDISISNVSVRPMLPAGTIKVTFNAGTYGGNMNLKINGDFLNFTDIATINGITLGGVSITATGSQNTPGIWTLEGSINSLEVGGQEYWMDNLCIETDDTPQPNCEVLIQFEDLVVGTNYGLGDVFTSNSLDFTVVQFIWGNNLPSPNGNVTVSNQQSSGGTGNDISISNVSVSPALPAGTVKITLNAGTYGGNMNLKINGDFINFNDVATINSSTLGGVTVTASGSQNTPGIWTLEGSVTSLEIGGQEFWIDNICITTE